MARPFNRAAAFRTPSITAANPSSSARRSHIAMSAFPFWSRAEQWNFGICLVEVAHDRGNFPDHCAIVEHESRDHQTGIDGSVGVRELFLCAKVDRLQLDIEPLL